MHKTTESGETVILWNKFYDDIHGSFSISVNLNCSQDIIDLGQSCVPLRRIGDSCILCCTPTSHCCHCHECDACRTKNWNLITATQIIVLLLFVFGILFVVIMYFRTCNRRIGMRRSVSNAVQTERNTTACTDRSNSSQCYTVEETRDRPPSYNEACSAPPLYTCPYNRVSMLEAPPVYPETPKSSERVSHSIASPLTSVHHI